MSTSDNTNERDTDDRKVHDDIREGDWVRFYRNGQLVIAEVRYTKEREPYGRAPDVFTDGGSVSADMIIEVRRLAEWIQS